MVASDFNGSALVVPRLSRNAAISFWRDREACDTWHASEASAQWRDGWSARCEILRAIGSWPGVPNDVPRGVAAKTDGTAPVIGLTIGPLRIRNAGEFTRLNTAAEKQLLAARGLTWASGFSALPLLLCTVSLWEDEAALTEYIRNGAHQTAIKATNEPGYDPALPDGNRFFGQNCTMRLRPYSIEGSLGGKNPVAATQGLV